MRIITRSTFKQAFQTSRSEISTNHLNRSVEMAMEAYLSQTKIIENRDLDHASGCWVRAFTRRLIGTRHFPQGCLFPEQRGVGFGVFWSSKHPLLKGIKTEVCACQETYHRSRIPEVQRRGSKALRMQRRRRNSGGHCHPAFSTPQTKHA